MRVSLYIHKGPGSKIEELSVELASLPRINEVVIVTRRYFTVDEVHHLAIMPPVLDPDATTAILFCMEL